MRSVVVANGPGALGAEARVGPHRLILDEPIELGGADAGPSPYETVLAALGACTSATVKLYAQRKGWQVVAVDVRLSLHLEPGRQARIEKQVRIEGELDAEQLERCYQIASKCPVHRLLSEGAELDVRDG